MFQKTAQLARVVLASIALAFGVIACIYFAAASSALEPVPACPIHDAKPSTLADILDCQSCRDAQHEKNIRARARM